MSCGQVLWETPSTAGEGHNPSFQDLNLPLTYELCDLPKMVHTLFLGGGTCIWVCVYVRAHRQAHMCVSTRIQ